MSRGDGVDNKVLIIHSLVLKHYMYVVYERFECRRKLSTFLRLLWSLPDTVSCYIRDLVKVAKQFK